MFWRATVFTFGKPAKKRTLKRLLNDFAENELVEPQDRTEAWERREVGASASRGLGFNWVEVSRGEKRGGRVSPEERIEVFQLQAVEHNVRLGYTDYMERVREFGKDKRKRIALGDIVKSFWEWLSS